MKKCNKKTKNIKKEPLDMALCIVMISFILNLMIGIANVSNGNSFGGLNIFIAGLLSSLILLK